MHDEPAYMFSSLNDLLHFVKWLTDNFDTPEDFEVALSSISADDDTDLQDALGLVLGVSYCTRQPASTDDGYLECEECGGIFATESGLRIHQTVLHAEAINKEKNDEFWNIIKNSYENHNEGNNDNLHNTD